MFDYLQKFNKLPKDLRGKVSTPVVMSMVEDLEKRYGVDLATIIMKVMIKEIAITNLARYFVNENNLDEIKAKQLVEELEEKIFVGVKDYLGIAGVKDGARRDVKISSIMPMQKPKPTLFVTGANFFFSPEDEEEIRELTKKINGEIGDKLFNGQIDKKLDKIVVQVQINFGSEQLLNRFKEILKTYLRGIRDRIEIRQTLMKSFKEGGLSFDNESVDKVLAIIEDIKNLKLSPTQPPTKIKLPEDEISSRKPLGLKDIGVRDVDYDLSSLKNKVTDDRRQTTEKIKNGARVDELDIKHELAPLPPSLRKIESRQVGLSEKDRPKSPVLAVHKPKIISVLQEKDKSAIRPDSITKPKQTGGFKIKFRSPGDSIGKKKMEDVKYIPKIMNPIDELHYMDLVNFRRLAKDPYKIITKIKEKISLLEEEKYSKRLEGIKGWRQSPVNKLYLQIGQQSISKNKPIGDIIEERKNANQDYLTSEEFKAIMDLNKSLRF